ncbi:MAG: AbrB/MazE/SpoVT family DNA-binding domain-containing protein [Actinobacteria bacterium]|nr:AbrB/MazE/SpoVT family DNA-binding domain-containing protein [Actinomycetota bacterium]
MKLVNSVRVGKKGQIVIPGYIRESLKLEENSVLSIYLESSEGKVILVPVNKIGTLTKGILKGAWDNTREKADKYIKKERESWKRVYQD